MAKEPPQPIPLGKSRFSHLKIKVRGKYCFALIKRLKKALLVSVKSLNVSASHNGSDMNIKLVFAELNVAKCDGESILEGKDPPELLSSILSLRLFPALSVTG